MKVKVISPKWGRHKKDDELDLPESTAKAIAKHGKVELLESEEAESGKKKTKK